MQLPADFRDRLQQQLGNAFSEYEQILENAAPVSIRLNPHKTELTSVGTPVPWTKHGRYLGERPIFTLDPLLHAGVYYVQEASSMFLEQVFAQILPNEPLNILDLCAAPGGKSTHIATLMHPDGLLVSNEVIRSRAHILKENIAKCGTGNTIITNNDPRDFGSVSGFFDVAVIDAPCSGEGLFRRDHKAMDEWSTNNVKLCSERQQRILMDVWDAIKPGGIIVYSTCTFSPDENEQNLAWLAEQHEVESLELTLNPGWNIEATELSGMHGYRFYPHKVTGEGFFISVVRKRGEQGESTTYRSKKSKLEFAPKHAVEQLNRWIQNADDYEWISHREIVHAFPKRHVGTLEHFLRKLKVVGFGVETAEVKKKNLRVSHELALFTQLDKSQFNIVDLDQETALQYLHKDNLDLPDAPQGELLLTFQGHPIGFAKKINRRVNNQYPKEWRIRMDVSGLRELKSLTEF